MFVGTLLQVGHLHKSEKLTLIKCQKSRLKTSIHKIETCYLAFDTWASAKVAI